ncbi:MAG: hypothetical protein ACKVZJ_14365 [Phycisphaerales bacterium]
MPPIHLAAGNLRCTVLPEIGGGISDFSVIGPGKFAYPLMRRAMPGETNPSSLGSFFMAPWVNRIGSATFDFGGVTHRLRPNAPTPGAPAQHGDVRARAWKVVSSVPDRLELSFDSVEYQNMNWPWRFACRAVYALSGGGTALRVELSVENQDSAPFPAGCGHHPYFMRRLWDDRDELRLSCPVTGRYPLENGVPTGPARREALTELLGAPSGTPVPNEHIDTVFAGFDAARGATLHYPASGVRLTVRASPNMGHLVVYCPHANGLKDTPLGFVAVEPQSQVNGALNWASWGDGVTGTQVLGPGERLETWTEFGVVGGGT